MCNIRHLRSCVIWHDACMYSGMRREPSERGEMKMGYIDIISYASGRVLDRIGSWDISRWCAEHGYLPHHQVRRGWVVIR